jgi:hypothetical protein
MFYFVSVAEWRLSLGLSKDSGEDVFKRNYLTIEVGETVLELLPMGDLPARKVMDMLKAKQSERLESALILMKLAAKNPAEFETEAEFMSFNELVAGLDLWMDKSSDRQFESGLTVQGESTRVLCFGKASSR